VSTKIIIVGTSFDLISDLKFFFFMHMYEQHNAMSLVLLSHISQDTKISFSNSMRENNVECSFADRVTIIK
jgi:hypothetical protein